MPNKRKYDYNYILKEAKLGKKPCEIAKAIHARATIVAQILRRNNYGYDVNRLDHNFFKKIDNEEKAYWLGFIMADGCVCYKPPYYYVSLTLSGKDCIQVERWYKAIKLNKKPRKYKDKDGYFKCVGSFGSKVMCQDLINLGCIPKKTETLDFPTKIPNNLIHHFVRGYFDGDGCVLISCGQVIASFVGTEKFLIGLRKVLGIDKKLQKATVSTKVKYLVIGGNRKALSFYDWLYKDAIIFLERKKQIFDNHYSKYQDKRTSKYFGVGWCKKINKWRARIILNKKEKHIGYFDKEIDAVLAYNKIALTFNRKQNVI